MNEMVRVVKNQDKRRSGLCIVWLCWASRRSDVTDSLPRTIQVKLYGTSNICTVQRPHKLSCDRFYAQPVYDERESVRVLS